jgi:Protein of unknown function (DUF3500)
LGELEGSKAPFARDPEMYYLTVFGTPGQKWGWRVEGHHLSVNFTLAGDKEIADTPSFLGANPAEVRKGPRQGLRILAAEEDLARKLVKSFDEGQRQTAIMSVTAPKDIVTAAERKVKPLESVGLSFAKMNREQRGVLLKVIQEYVRRVRSEVADKDLEKIRKAGHDKIQFAWAGGMELGQAHYYRVQGPTFLLEYDNTQNDANHVHAVWRDFENDFGEDLLRRHYEQVPHTN